MKLKPIPRYLFLVSRLVSIMILFTICRVLFYWFNGDLFQDIPSAELVSIFLGGIRFDLTGMLYLNLIYILMVTLPFRFVSSIGYQKWADRVFLFFNGLGMLMNTIDMAYYPFTMHRTTGSVFKIFENEGSLTLASVFLNGFVDFWPITLSAIVLIYLVYLITKTFRFKPSPLKDKPYYIIYSISIFAAFYFSVIGIRSGFGLKHVRPLAISHAGEYVSNTRNIAIVLNTPFSILRTLRQETYKRKTDFSETELNRIFNPVKTIIPDGPKLKKNVVILIIESLSKEHSGFLNPDLENGQYKGHTPFLDSLMQESLTFTNGFANGHKSIDGMPSVLAGIPALKSHYVISNYSTNHLEGLGFILEREGYDQAYFHGAPNGSMGFGAFANLLKLDKYYGMDEYGNPDDFDGTWGVWDEEFLQFMANTLDDLSAPFHATFFSLSSHHPYDIPERYEGMFERGKHGLTKVMKYTDYALRRFFETAKTKPWYNNTIFVITADHASVPYHDEYKTKAGIYKVPILFFTPDGSLKGLDGRVAQQLDIFPTIVDYLNIPTSYFSFGSSLLDSTYQRFAINQNRSGAFQLFDDSLLYQFQGNNRKLYRYKTDVLLKDNIYQSQDMYLDTLARAILQQFNNRMLDDRLRPEE